MIKNRISLSFEAVITSSFPGWRVSFTWISLFSSNGIWCSCIYQFYIPKFLVFFLKGALVQFSYNSIHPQIMFYQEIRKFHLVFWIILMSLTISFLKLQIRFYSRNPIILIQFTIPKPTSEGFILHLTLPLLSFILFEHPLFNHPQSHTLLFQTAFKAPR